MPIYTAVPLQSNQPALNAAVVRVIPPQDRYPLASDRGWLIKFDGTTIELCNVLGVTGQPAGIPSIVGSVIVVAVSAYYGRGSTDMWEWLKTRFEQ
jgi:hypothetical protein